MTDQAIDHDELIENVADIDSDADPFEAIADPESPDDLGDPFIDDIADDLPEDVRAELEALAATELDGDTGLEQALANAQREVVRHRAETRAVLARYREAVLTAEPDLPPDLIHGDTLEELDAAITAARDVVARVRERVREETATRGFPVGAPGRERGVQGVLTPTEKIARGLSEGR